MAHSRNLPTDLGHLTRVRVDDDDGQVVEQPPVSCCIDIDTAQNGRDFKPCFMIRTITWFGSNVISCFAIAIA